MVSKSYAGTKFIAPYIQKLLHNILILLCFCVYRARVTVQDNTPAMQELLTINVTDGDEPNTLNSQVTLMLDGDHGGRFAVVNHTIISSMALPVDQYNITIVAQDGGTPTQSTTARVTIDVVNSNNNPPVFDILDDISFTENDNETYTFTINDDDSGDEGIPMTPEITGQFASNFTINQGSTANEFVLMPTVPLDREVEETLLLILTVSDSGAAMFRRTTSTNITVIVEDVNDNVPIIENLTPGLIISVSEETASGHVVYQVSASDRDNGTNAELSFTIESVDMMTIPFAIDAQSGNITTTSVINDPVNTDFSVNVTVTDGGSPALSVSRIVNILVTETNNNRPVFNNLPSSVNISESLPVNNLVVQDFNVTDSDIDDAGTFRVELQQTGSFFRIDGDSVRLNQAVDFEVSIRMWFYSYYIDMYVSFRLQVLMSSHW